MKKNTSINDRISYIIDIKADKNKKKFSETIGFAPQVISNIVSGRKTKPSFGVIKAISSSFVDINLEWLITGKGEMLKTEGATSKNLIPFHQDVESIGGNSVVASMNGITQSTEMIDAGDWFPSATAAIRHYNDSMKEYPSGCILALREIKEVHSIVWGRNHVVETDEIRVTKKIQTCPNSDDFIMAYSTNTETYPDGRQVHEPLTIRKTDIRRMFIVLGRIVKEELSGPVYVK